MGEQANIKMQFAAMSTLHNTIGIIYFGSLFTWMMNLFLPIKICFHPINVHSLCGMQMSLTITVAQWHGTNRD